MEEFNRAVEVSSDISWWLYCSSLPLGLKEWRAKFFKLIFLKAELMESSLCLFNSSFARQKAFKPLKGRGSANIGTEAAGEPDAAGPAENEGAEVACPWERMVSD